MRLMSAVITYALLFGSACWIGGGMVPKLGMGDKDDEKENGFDGIYLVQMVSSDETRQIKTDVVSAKVDFEPVRSLASHEKYAIRPWRVRRTIYDKLVNTDMENEEEARKLIKCELTKYLDCITVGI